MDRFQKFPPQKYTPKVRVQRDMAPAPGSRHGIVPKPQHPVKYNIRGEIISSNDGETLPDGEPAIEELQKQISGLKERLSQSEQQTAELKKQVQTLEEMVRRLLAKS